MATIVRLNQSITNADAPRLREILTSDDFSGTGELVGSMTSAALGGEPMQWSGVPGWTREDGAIRTPQGSINDILTLEDMPENLIVTYRVVRMPSNGFLALSLRSTSNGRDRVVLGITNLGFIWFENRKDGQTTRSPAVNGVRQGDIIGIRAVGENLEATINGGIVNTWTTDILGRGDLRLSTYPIIDAAIDDLVVEVAR